ncbi:MAG: DUF1772 domain-containing protein [Anaerolineae bacterium]|nr:DUF1772 domain-containing protein [Anaerolineae bacterium]NUQ05340.1 DUF1772 domain-containing protein [Anaerolineae bacterium]
MLENVILIAGGTLTALLAGLFADFSAAVVPALRSLPAQQHLLAMQAINVKIKNPVFLLMFLGPSILLPLAAWLHQGTTAFPLLASAAALHIIGGNGITILGNVPLNDRLEALDLRQYSETDAERVRQEYHGPGARWVRLHDLRTLAVVGAAALAFAACLAKGASD